LSADPASVHQRDAIIRRRKKMSLNNVVPVVDLDLTEQAFDDYCRLKLNETKPEMRIVFVLGAIKDSLSLTTNNIQREDVIGKATKRKRTSTKVKEAKVSKLRKVSAKVKLGK
jgi:hypothetical protein